MTEREPDIEIRASARGRELRFECKPEAQVTAHSNTPARAETASERHNLPGEIEPGVTYRDFRVRWRASVRLKDD
jgi:hypothetical protein